MKKVILLVLFAVPVLLSNPAKSQDVYQMSSWENLFQWADVPNTPQQGVNSINPRLRYTIVFNVGQYTHLDFTNSIGLYTGLAVRNVGFIYDTDRPTKTIRRSYNLGVPLALKIGAFDKHMYIFGGGEYELLFHYRARRWDSNDRNGNKQIVGEWFSGRTKRFVPSVFAGVQFPGGFNIKYKFYLQHFLNENYIGSEFSESNVAYADYNGLKMHYIAICWQFRTDQWKKYSGMDRTAKSN